MNLNQLSQLNQFYNLSAEDFQPMAKVVAWEVSNTLLIKRDEFHAHALAAGIPGICIPKELRTRARFQRSLKAIKKEDLDTLQKEGVFHPVLEDDERSVMCWVTHEVDPSDEKVTFQTERKFTYWKEDGRVLANDPDRLFELREIFQVLPAGDPSAQFIEQEIAELEEQVRETQRRLDDLMQHFAEVMQPSDIRAFLTKCIDAASGIPMRGRGGVYIVARPMFDIVESMQIFLSLIDISGGSTLKIINVLDVPKLADSLKAMAENLGIDSTDLMAVLDMAKEKLDNSDDIETIFSSFEGHFMGEIDKLQEELDGFRKAGRSTREQTLLDRMQMLSGLADQAEMFAKLLSFESQKYLDKVREVEDNLQAYAKENDVRKDLKQKAKVSA